MTNWQDIADILTPDGIERLNPGQVLMFDFEGGKVHLKIKRKDLKRGKVWAEETRLYTKEELDDMWVDAQKQEKAKRKKGKK